MTDIYIELEKIRKRINYEAINGNYDDLLKVSREFDTLLNQYYLEEKAAKTP